MQVRALSAAAAIAVVALVSAACSPASKSKATGPTSPFQTASATTAAATTAAAAPASAASSASAPNQPAASSAAAVSSTAPSSPAATTPAATTPAATTPAATTPAATTPAPAAGGGGGSINVCSLLTSAQASSINGVTYGAATPQQFQAGLDACDYKNNGSTNPVDIQDLTTQVISLPDCYAQLLQAEGPGTKVSGVGDAAFGYSIGIEVKVGNRCIEVSGLTEAELDDNYAPDVAMAKIMISNLH
jgi:hypothetical protein